MSYYCWRCGKPLSDPISVRLSIGPICRAKMLAEGSGDAANERGTVATLPFDPETMDIVCRRDGDRKGVTHFNISQRIVKHSATGFEWGYSGSGPSEFALNILALFIGQEPAERSGAYHEFKAQFVATLPEEGGTIKGDDIRAWIREHLRVEAAQSELVW